MASNERRVGRLIDHIGMVVRDFPACKAFYTAVFNALKIPIGGSDAHILGAIGKSHTLFPGRTADDLRRAILSRRVVAATAWYRPADLVAYAAFWVRISRAHGAPAV